MKTNPVRIFWAIAAMVLLVLLAVVSLIVHVRQRRRRKSRLATPYEVQLEAARIFGVDSARIDVTRSTVPPHPHLVVQVPRAKMSQRLAVRLMIRLEDRVPTPLMVTPRDVRTITCAGCAATEVIDLDLDAYAAGWVRADLDAPDPSWRCPACRRERPSSSDTTTTTGTSRGHGETR